MVEGETDVAHTFTYENTQPEMSHANPTAQEVDQSVERVKPIMEEELQRLQPLIDWIEAVQLDKRIG